MKKALQAGKKIAGMACILVFGCLLSVLSCSHAQAGAGDQDKAQGPGRILRVAYPELEGMRRQMRMGPDTVLWWTISMR